MSSQPRFQAMPFLASSWFWSIFSPHHRILCKDRVLPDNRNCCTPSLCTPSWLCFHTTRSYRASFHSWKYRCSWTACTKNPPVTLETHSRKATAEPELLSNKSHPIFFSLSRPSYWCTKLGFTEFRMLTSHSISTEWQQDPKSSSISVKLELLLLSHRTE